MNARLEAMVRVIREQTDSTVAARIAQIPASVQGVRRETMERVIREQGAARMAERIAEAEVRTR